MNDIFRTYKFSLVKTQVNGVGILFDTFKREDGFMDNCYYNKKGYCFKLMEFRFKRDLTNKIAALDSEYTKVNDRKWVSKNANIKARLYISNEWFQVVSEDIKLKDK